MVTWPAAWRRRWLLAINQVLPYLPKSTPFHHVNMACRLMQVCASLSSTSFNTSLSQLPFTMLIEHLVYFAEKMVGL